MPDLTILAESDMHANGWDVLLVAVMIGGMALILWVILRD